MQNMDVVHESSHEIPEMIIKLMPAQTISAKTVNHRRNILNIGKWGIYTELVQNSWTAEPILPLLTKEELRDRKKTKITTKKRMRTYGMNEARMSL